jgi:hypothetical protein
LWKGWCACGIDRPLKSVFNKAQGKLRLMKSVQASTFRDGSLKLGSHQRKLFRLTRP